MRGPLVLREKDPDRSASFAGLSRMDTLVSGGNGRSTPFKGLRCFFVCIKKYLFDVVEQMRERLWLAKLALNYIHSFGELPGLWVAA